MLGLYVLLTLFVSVGWALPLAEKDTAEKVKYWALPAKRVVRDTEVKRFVKRDENGDYLDLALTYESTFYIAEVLMGSNSQKLDVLLDTGSSDFWVVASKNSYCEAGTAGSLQKGRKISSIFGPVDNTTDTGMNKGAVSKSASDAIDCSQYGTFDQSASTSFHSNGTSFAIAYDDQTFAKGTWGQDTIRLGSVRIDHMNVAVCDNTDNAQGVLGIGLPGLEVTSSNTDTNKYEYENLPIKLVRDGIISKAAYSVYLDASSNSEILFGAVDSSKYEGELVALPIVNALASQGITSKIQLTVTVNSLAVLSAGGNKAAAIGAGAIPALLDTGTTLTYAPQNIIDSFVSLLGLEYSDSIGYYVGPCTLGDTNSVRFDFQGLQLDIPLSNFFISLTTASLQPSTQCAFGILSSNDETYLTLGQSFLQSVYMVADLEDMKIALAMSSSKKSPQDISPIDSVIPQAKNPQHTSTYGPGFNAFEVTALPSARAVDLSSVEFLHLPSSHLPFVASSVLKSTFSASTSTFASSSATVPSSSSHFSSSNAVSSSAASPAASSTAASTGSSASSLFSVSKGPSQSIQSTARSASSVSSSKVSPSASKKTLSRASASTSPLVSSSSATFASRKPLSSLRSSSISAAAASPVSSISQDKKNAGTRLSAGASGIALMFIALL